MQRSALCRSRRELSNAYFVAKFGLDTAENEPCKVCPTEQCSSQRALKAVGTPAAAAGPLLSESPAKEPHGPAAQPPPRAKDIAFPPRARPACKSYTFQRLNDFPTTHAFFSVRRPTHRSVTTTHEMISCFSFTI